MAGRQCLICGGPTKGAHLGVDACRACTAFFRRAAAKKRPYACRKGRGNCDKQRGESIVSCRHCRYARCLSVGMRIRDSSEDDGSLSPPEEPYLLPSTSTGLSQEPKPPTTLKLFNQIREQLSIMHLVRKTNEVAARSTQNPTSVDGKEVFYTEDGMAIIPASYEATNEWARVSVTVAGHFIESTFDKFQELSLEEKWIVLKNFFNLYFFYDIFYYTKKLFPDSKRFLLATYTSYFDMDDMEYFFRNVRATQGGKIPLAKQLIKQYTEESDKMITPMMNRAAMTEEEKQALIGLMVWTPSMDSCSDNINNIGEHYRRQIFHELHVYYKEKMGIENYAERMGNMTMLLMCLQEHGRQTQEKYQVFRILDIFNDDTYMYQMTR